MGAMLAYFGDGGSVLGRREHWAFPALRFGGPPPYLHGVCADHAQRPIPVPNLGRARLAGPPVSRYPRWQRRSGVVLDLPFS